MHPAISVSHRFFILRMVTWDDNTVADRVGWYKTLALRASRS
jgi:hypothetical protein